MSRINPYTLRMQVTRLFENKQAFFATIKVQDWLKERQLDPNDYQILFHEKPAPPGSIHVIEIDIELQRKDGQPVEDWLQEDVNSCS
ncbi:MAG: hypothetical protein AAGG51_08070 [Cyanobacteria bacterium P01_G01_bin.54]